MKFHVDQDMCIGCGCCTGLCPKVFEMGDSGKAQALTDDVAGAALTDAQSAMDSCPVGAISAE